MAAINNHWYNLNEQRDYPIDETSTALSNAGDRVPSSIVTDIKLRWPLSLGRYAFISAISSTTRLVTVMIEVTNTLANSPATSILIAGISVAKADLFEGRTYAFETFQPSVGGFITFGSGTEQPYSGVFASPLQSLLTSRACLAVGDPPVESLQVGDSATAMQGMVNLEPIAPLTITKETRVIGELEYEDTLVFRLEPEVGAPVGVGNSVLAKFAGKCGERVGTRSCSGTQPIETINGVKPDCDGVITLDFRGCTVIGKNIDDCGVYVDCSLGLSDSCDPPFLPELDTGLLPYELNQDSIDVTPVLRQTDTEQLIQEYSIVDLSPAREIIVLQFPYYNDFTGEKAKDLIPSQGQILQPLSKQGKVIGLGTDNIAALSSYNTVLFKSDIQCYGREYNTKFKINNTGEEASAGIILNHRENGKQQYFFIGLDVISKSFKLQFVDGSNILQLSAVTATDISTTDYYTLKVTVKRTEAGKINLSATISADSDRQVFASISSPLPSLYWDDSYATTGLQLAQATGYFLYWDIMEIN